MIEVVRELNRSYLSITQENDNIYDYTMKMVENNSVEGLLAVRKSVVNNKTSYLYDISGCIPLEEKYVKDEFDGDDILAVADSVNKLINTMERYMLDINNAVSRAQQMNASDIHIVSGRPVKCRIDGQITTLDERVIPAQECEEIIRELAGENYSLVEKIGELDMALTFECGARTRINIFRSNGAVSAAIRILSDHIPEI